jgi:hypothetical protein
MSYARGVSAISCTIAGRPPGGIVLTPTLKSRMPIHECDPWRARYLREIVDPSELGIPVDDTEAFNLNPAHRWVYDKLLVAKSQGLRCGSHDVAPLSYPVFSKPVTNLKDMGVGTRVLLSERDYREYCGVGDFWMKLLTGEHVSTDFAVVKGDIAWCRHTLGIADVAGTFDYWVMEERSRPQLERYCRQWILANLAGYTGMLNLESIGGCIIEAHLRFCDQWPDLYGRKWRDAVVRLYQRGTWDLIDQERAEVYSVVLFGPHGRTYAYPRPEAMAAYEATVGISSIQLTFFEDRPPEAHAMPPGGFRLAVINCFNLEVGLRIRAALAREFGIPAGPYRRRTSAASLSASALNAWL